MCVCGGGLEYFNKVSNFNSSLIAGVRWAGLTISDIVDIVNLIHKSRFARPLYPTLTRVNETFNLLICLRTAATGDKT